MNQIQQSNSREALLPYSDNFPKNYTKQIVSVQSCIQNRMQEQKNKPDSKTFRHHKADNFSSLELKNLFDFYDQYGPKWSNFQQLIPGRSQNQLKNKFHSTVRTLCRLIIAASGINQQSTQFISSSKISSKVLVDLYQGKKTFKKYKHFMKKMLQVIDFEVNKEKQKIERCRVVLGVHTFRKICDQLLKTVNYKVISKIPQKKESVCFEEAQEKKLSNSQNEAHPSPSKCIPRVIQQNQPPLTHNLEPLKKNQTDINCFNPLNKYVCSQIHQNNLEIMQNLLWALHLQQTTPNSFPILPFPQELKTNLSRLSTNLLKFGNNF